jgi:micrococcal nuclease
MNCVFQAVFLCCYLFVCSCTSGPSSPLTATEGRVVAIADGDTFTLLSGDQEQVKIRLYGIDCPERKQDFGQVAKQRLSDLVFGQKVSIIKKDIDRYGRTVALVYKKDTCINEELLKEGLAWHYVKYDQNPAWELMEKQTRREKVGLWVQPHAIPPWEWRRKK